MATLNLSTNGPSIAKSYQAVVESPLPSGSAASSPTYGQWALFSVSAPLVNAFQKDTGGKESVLKVQSTGDGELLDLIEDFSDGRIQFAFVKVRDPNTTLPKSVLIGWCGEGVPERTKGYFTSHLAAVGKALHGYHVQITARSDRDLNPDIVIRKVSEASGSNYSGGSTSGTSSTAAPPPPLASKPAFTPTRSGGGGGSFNPLVGKISGSTRNRGEDEDGWGADAPPVSRSELERVQSSYKPTTVDMAELRRGQESSRPSSSFEKSGPHQTDVVRGGYQPVGKVDIAAIRRQAQGTSDERPQTVKGAYEPVGKVDITAIRARAQPVSSERTVSSNDSSQWPYNGSESARPSNNPPDPVPQSERLTSLPRPKVGNKLGSSASSFSGTKAPLPGSFGLESKPTPSATPIGAASRTFADEGGKTPAQVWAEKKARERGLSGTSDSAQPIAAYESVPAIASQKSGGEWKSGYTGKSWAPVQLTHTGRSKGSSDDQQHTGQDDEGREEVPHSPGGVGALRDRFASEQPMGAPSLPRNQTGERSAPSPPPLDTSTKPNAGVRPGASVAMPGLAARPGQPGGETEEEQEEVGRLPTPPAVPRSPTPPTPPAMRKSSPIRVAMPVGRGKEPEVIAPEERFSPPSVPAESIAKLVPRQEDLTDEPIGHDPARAAGEAAAAATFGEAAVHAANPGARAEGKRALIQFDYEKAEGNEIDLVEGEYVTNIEMVDENWWMGQNSKGEAGLFPSNYVELIDNEQDEHHHTPGAAAHHEEPAPSAEPVPTAAVPKDSENIDAAAGRTATALYDYEAAEPNELTFAEGAKITSIEFPDEDWWFGHHNAKEGLFPANYVQLEE